MSNVITALVRRLEELERRQNNIIREGRVTDVDPAKGMVRLALADGADGTVTKSPWVKPSENAGSLQTWALPKVGQWMKLISPNGEIGKNSMAISHSWANDKGQPSSEADEPMLKVGGSTLKLKDGLITITGATIELHGSVNTYGALTNNGTDVGSTHKHTGVTPGVGITGTPV